MMGLRGKGVFGRGPSLYTNGFIPWAVSLGADWVAVLGIAPGYRAEALAAKRAGLRVLLWSGPTSWSPSNWRHTADLLEQRALEVDAWGVIADPEDWQNPNVDPSERWGNAGLEEIGRLGDRLALMQRRGLNVCVTSFPTWGGAEGRRVLASRSGAIGMPQVYSPASPATLLARARMFSDFRSVVPILAAWNRGDWTPRTPATLAEYYKLFAGYGAIGFWTGWGQRTTEQRGFADAMRRAQSGGILGIPKRIALAMGAATLLALLATGTLKLKR